MQKPTKNNERAKKNKRRKHYIPTNGQEYFFGKAKDYIRKGLKAYFTV
jgi:hypothetical protein